MKKTEINNVIFENIKHVDVEGREYWEARELQKVLVYKEWRKFENVIAKAQKSCENSGNVICNHFVDIDKMIVLAKGAKRKVIDYKLSRYACYLIVQNADPRKEVIALGQTYFAIQTRKMEITEKEYSSLTETEKRFYQRDLTRKGNYSLNQTAKRVGVKNFDKFHNAGMLAIRVFTMERQQTTSLKEKV